MIKIYEEFIESEKVQNDFSILKRAWISEVGYQSNPQIIYDNDNYQKIISLGIKVVPILINDLVRENHDWFKALSEILGVNPVKKENEGNFEKMKTDWLEYFNK